MTVRTAREVADGDKLECDICVIGGGAAGITLARQLDGTRKRVIVLEAGGFVADSAAEADSFGLEYAGEPHRNMIPARGRWFGGSTNLWFGRIALPDPIDFERRPWVPHSGWPIALDEVRRWYDAAFDILGVAEPTRLDIDAWPVNRTTETFMAPGATSMGVFVWSDRPKLATWARPLIERSRNVSLVTDSTATELVADNTTNTISAVRAVGPGRRGFDVMATHFVLAAGGLENPRLLLASTRDQPAGVGNHHDNVGRYYLDHPRGEGLARVDLRGLPADKVERLALLDERADPVHGKVQLRVVFAPELQRSHNTLNHSLHGFLVTDSHRSDGFQSFKRVRTALSSGHVPDRNAMYADVARTLRSAPSLVALGIRRAVGQARPTEFIVVDQLEQEPDPASRVTVVPREFDQFGLPRLRLDWRIGESTRRSQHRMHGIVRDRLAAVGITTFTSGVLDHPEEAHDLLDMKHPSGTTRMSFSPRTGVVDLDGRVHGTTNLYVAGSSTFPTSGHFNPTLVIVALAARLADHLRQCAR